ncbi:MAG TPA: hypothetical protein VEF35_07590 [Candidatus Bathyarchaeia archaeon]|nr:hypothetical protein [Candidatus Bathyarchaeia archaeon]
MRTNTFLRASIVPQAVLIEAIGKRLNVLVVATSIEERAPLAFGSTS